MPGRSTSLPFEKRPVVSTGGYMALCDPADLPGAALHALAAEEMDSPPKIP